jgi:hypothetical protein
MSGRQAIGRVPRERPPALDPEPRSVAGPPAGTPVGRAPVPQFNRAPKPRPVGAPPNPRRPRLVKDVNGNELKDMFAIFKDLPRPARPAPRLPSRLRRGRPRR